MVSPLLSTNLARPFLSGLLGSLLAAWTWVGLAQAAEVQSVAQVDLKLYSGVWYEIASFPSPFQPSDCTGTTATYTANTDGSVKVWNQCYQPTAAGLDKLLRVEGKAIPVNGQNSQLKVYFFGPFGGDYWILDLDDNYQTALVGAPNRRFLWILHREPTLDSQTYNALLKKAEAQGFDTRNLKRTPPRKSQLQ